MRKGWKRTLLFLYAFLADEYTQLSPGEIYRRLWWQDYRPRLLTQAVSRMVRIGEIARKVNEKGEPVLVLQAKGGKLLNEVLPLCRLQSQKWDGKWRMVVFDIPEKQRNVRNALRKKLRLLGFGKWQKSVYVTPHDVMPEMNEYLEEERLYPLVVCFESRRVGFGEDEEFAQAIFQTGRLNKRYKSLIDESKKVERLFKGSELLSSELDQRCRNLWMRYLELVESDPFLPYELLPQPWFAEEAKVAIRCLVRLQR